MTRRRKDRVSYHANKNKVKNKKCKKETNFENEEVRKEVSERGTSEHQRKDLIEKVETKEVIKKETTCDDVLVEDNHSKALEYEKELVEEIFNPKMASSPKHKNEQEEIKSVTGDNKDYEVKALNSEDTINSEYHDDSEACVESENQRKDLIEEAETKEVIKKDTFCDDVMVEDNHSKALEDGNELAIVTTEEDSINSNKTIEGILDDDKMIIEEDLKTESNEQEDDRMTKALDHADASSTNGEFLGHIVYEKFHEFFGIRQPQRVGRDRNLLNISSDQIFAEYLRALIKPFIIETVHEVYAQKLRSQDQKVLAEQSVEPVADATKKENFIELTESVDAQSRVGIDKFQELHKKPMNDDTTTMKVHNEHKKCNITESSDGKGNRTFRNKTKLNDQEEPEEVELLAKSVVKQELSINETEYNDAKNGAGTDKSKKLHDTPIGNETPVTELNYYKKYSYKGILNKEQVSEKVTPQNMKELDDKMESQKVNLNKRSIVQDLEVQIAQAQSHASKIEKDKDDDFKDNWLDQNKSDVKDYFNDDKDPYNLKLQDKNESSKHAVTDEVTVAKSVQESDNSDELQAEALRIFTKFLVPELKKILQKKYHERNSLGYSNDISDTEVSTAENSQRQLTPTNDTSNFESTRIEDPDLEEINEETLLMDLSWIPKERGPQEELEPKIVTYVEQDKDKEEEINDVPLPSSDEKYSSLTRLAGKIETSEEQIEINYKIKNEIKATEAKSAKDDEVETDKIPISIHHDEQQELRETVLHKEALTNEEAIVTNECNVTTDRALDVGKKSSCRAHNVAESIGDKNKFSNIHGENNRISEVAIKQDEEQNISELVFLVKEVQTTEQAIVSSDEALDVVITEAKNLDEEQATNKSISHKGVQTTEQVLLPKEYNVTTDRALDVGPDDDTTKSTVDQNKLWNSPLRFHKVHGETIRLSKSGFRAQRFKNSNLNSRGIAFSSRPVGIGEKVCLHLEQISSSWLGLVTFGFTKYDPDTLVGNLPANIISDRNSNDGYWAVNLEEIYCRESNKLHYLLNSSGNMCFGINGVDQGEFFWKLDTSKPMWAVVEIIGYFTAVEFDNPKILISKERLNSSTERTESADVTNQSLEKNQENSCRNRQISKLSHLKYQIRFVPLDLLTQVKGLRVQYMEDQGVLVTTDIRGGHIFLKYPLFPGQIIVVQNLSGNKLPQIFCVGIKFCDPETEASSKEHVPDPIATTVAMQFKDELAISFTKDGEVQVTKNFDVPNTLLKVNRTKKLWPFVAIYRRNQRIRIWSNNTPSPTTIQT